MSLRPLLLSLLLLFPFAAQAACPAPLPPVMTRYKSGLLFKIEKCGQPVSYLLGTMHADEADLLPHMPEVTIALKQSKEVALEYVASADDNRIAAEKMFLDPKKSPGGLEAMLGKAPYEKLAAQVKTIVGIPSMVVNRMKPWAAAVLVQYPPSTGDGVVLDKRIEDLAAKAKIPTYGLETLSRQLSYFDQLSDKQQLAMAREAVDDAAETAESNKKLLAAYRAKSLTRIQKLGDDSLAEIQDPAVRRFLNDTLIANRNAAMLAAFLPHLQKQPQLIAVGALHLPGPKGLLARLEKEGYSLTPLP